MSGLPLKKENVMKRIVLCGAVISLCLSAFTDAEAQVSKKQKVSPKTSSSPSQRQSVEPKADADAQSTKDAAKEKKPADDSLTFSGTVVDKDGLPLEGKVVGLILRDKNGKILILHGMKEGQLALATPNAKSDSKGRFTIKMEPYLKDESETDELEFGIYEGSRAYGLTKVTIHSKTTKTDLGKLVVQ